MIRTLIAQTNEVDEPDLAMIDLMAQLELDGSLQSASVGFLFGDLGLLDPDFLPSLSEILPFDLVGINASITTGPRQKDDFFLLTLMVLIGDDLEVATGLSDDLSENDLGCVEELYRRTLAKLEGPARLVLCFGSRPSSALRPDRVLARLNGVNGDAPVFGALGADLNGIASRGWLLYNGRLHLDRVALVAVGGPVKPRFSLYHIPENKILKRKAIVTSCEGNIIKQINGLPALDYLTTLGLVRNRKVEFSENIPLIIEDYKVGYWKPVLITGQIKDYIVCSQDVRVKTTLGIGGLNDSDVLKNAASLAEELRWEKFDFCLIHSCQGRHVALGLDYLGEIETLRSGLSDMLPYALCYTAGEFCPRASDKPGPANAFHNLALICCRF
ncbi:MAG: hypothetical protein LBO05_01410 [Deltaproteobacteria bacterium]|jgi:hypothetical protein|nr:hypothetical protein [Deltaproteobacteria bacterium]